MDEALASWIWIVPDFNIVICTSRFIDVIMCPLL
jgi:hypothetical protein